MRRFLRLTLRFLFVPVPVVDVVVVVDFLLTFRLTFLFVPVLRFVVFRLFVLRRVVLRLRVVLGFARAGARAVVLDVPAYEKNK